MEYINFLPPVAWTIIIIFLLGAIGTFIYKILTIDWKMKDLGTIRENAKPISQMPLEIKSLGNRLLAVELKVSHFRDEILAKLADVSTDIKTLSGQKFMEAKSPIALNSKGIELSEKMDALGIANKYKQKLINKAIKGNRNPYQIQQSCFDFATKTILADLEKKDEETFDRLTDMAYNEGVQVEALMQIIGLILRDQVLKALNKSSKDISKGIKTSDIISKKT